MQRDNEHDIAENINVNRKSFKVCACAYVCMSVCYCVFVCKYENVLYVQWKGEQKVTEGAYLA